MTSLDIAHLEVSFGSKKVIDDLSLSLKEGEIAALLGPSGCGKTTLLRAIAGLIQPNSGTIRFGAQLVGLSSVVLPPHRRGIGYVPQQGALFPHLSVAKNIAFGLDKKSHSKAEIAKAQAKLEKAKETLAADEAALAAKPSRAELKEIVRQSAKQLEARKKKLADLQENLTDAQKYRDNSSRDKAEIAEMTLPAAFAASVHPPFGLVTRLAHVIGRVRPETGGAAKWG